MNEELKNRFEDVLAKKVEELDELELTNPHHEIAAKDVVEMMKTVNEIDKTELEETEKDDRRVMDKEKLKLEKRSQFWDSLFKGLGMVGSGAALGVVLNFEKTGHIASNVGRAVVNTVMRGIGKLK